MPAGRPNVLFIMTDQMRADCMSGVGHPVVRTPHLDHLASEGVLFRRAYVQSAVCGPSRMCFYTGRYPHSNRSPWNEVPLPADEKTMGHYFGEAGYRAALCGKTHYTPDPFGDPGAQPEHGIRRAALAGLETWELNESRGEGWLAHLRSKGYGEDVIADPFAVEIPADAARTGHAGHADHAARDHSAYPTRFRREDSDTAFMTDRAMAFMDDAGDSPWFLHLSYFKPHLPIVAPYPYNELYDPADSPAPNRSPEELERPHPFHVPFRIERGGVAYDDEEVWRQRRATYYGLITEIDDHLGRLFGFMKDRGIWEDTLIVFTSDHGEYVGDHWMFEKELFYDEAYNVPFIVRDPRSGADATRGRMMDEFVESLDVLPTCLEVCGLGGADGTGGAGGADELGGPGGAGEPGMPPALQGRSLVPLLRGERPADWRREVFADWDFRFYWTPKKLGISPEKCRGWMVRDGRFKYWHFNGMPDVLFDLERDPGELRNVAGDPRYAEEVRDLRVRLMDWRMSNEDVSRVAWTYARRPGFGRDPFTA